MSVAKVPATKCTLQLIQACSCAKNRSCVGLVETRVQAICEHGLAGMREIQAKHARKHLSCNRGSCQVLSPHVHARSRPDKLSHASGLLLAAFAFGRIIRTDCHVWYDAARLVGSAHHGTLRRRPSQSESIRVWIRSSVAI